MFYKVRNYSSIVNFTNILRLDLILTRRIRDVWIQSNSLGFKNCVTSSRITKSNELSQILSIFLFQGKTVL